MIGKCLFCEGNSRIELSQKSDGLFYICNNCGRYFAEEKLETKLSEFTKEEKQKISNYLKNRKRNDFQEILTIELLKEKI